MVACYMYLYGHLFTVLAYVEALTISSLLALCYGFFLSMGFSSVWVFPLYGFFRCMGFSSVYIVLIGCIMSVHQCFLLFVLVFMTITFP